MAITVKHSKVSTIPDGDDTSLIRPSDWNQDHTLVGVGTAASLDAGVANGVATLDSSGKVPVSQIPALGDLNYQGTWNATTNTPTLTSSVGTKGYYYVVSVAGTTNLNGITDWQIGDWAVYNGSAWQKIDNTDAVTSVNGQTGTVVLTYSDVGAFPATATTGSGNVVLATGATQAHPTISDYETFTPTSAPSYAEGEIWYDSTQKALTYYNDVTNNAVHIGQEVQLKVINNTGSSIANGTPVYVTGTSSGQTYPNIALAKADAASTSAVLGLTNGTIASGATGYVCTSGLLTPCNTGSFSVGQVLYLSPYSAGQMMNTIPPTGYAVQIGVVAYANSPNGSIYVKQTTPLAVSAATITGTVAVNQGGTGVQTITGYVKGSGTSAFTGSSTIPTADLSGTITNAQLANSTITINGNSTALGGSVSVGTVTSVTATAPVASTGGTTPVISMPAATTSVSGYLTSTDWNTFNGKQPAGTYVNSVSATSPITSTGGVTPTIAMPAATSSVNGYLTSTDWTTFNSKQPAGSYLTAVTASAPLSGSGTAGSPLVISQATTTTNGYLTSTDWNTFNGKQAALVSGTNIKTVGGVSLLGAGDVGVIGGTYGGTGVNNGSNTITVAGNLTHTGAFTQSFTATANTAVTLPAGATASSNNLLSSATAVPIVTGTPSSTTYLRGDGTWASVSAGGTGSYVRTSFTATAGQTTFTATYTVGYVEVYQNGALLNATDYTASNGTSIVLAIGASTGDIIETIAYNTTTVAVAGGSNTQVQYNSSGSLAGSANMTFDGTTLTAAQLAATASVTASGNKGAISYGTLSYSDVNHLATFQSAVDSYSQIEIQNTNATSAASSDVIVANNNTTASTFYGDFGMNSSAWTGTAGTTSLSSPNMVYLTATSSDLTIGTTTSNAIRFVTNGGADKLIFDANGNVGIGVVPTGLDLLELGAGTTSKAPLGFTSGSLITSPDAGSVEFDGNNFYMTVDTSQGRNVNLAAQQFYLSAAGSALTGATQNYFGANSAASLAATSTYDIDCYCYFLKTTAGTVQWIPTFSSAITVGHSYLEYTPVTGFTTTVITGAMVTAEATQQTTTVLTHTATASLTSAVYHIAKLRIRVTTNLACNFRLNNTIGTGTITPQAGSYYTVRKVVTSAGNFVA
jgi:hypothetical protein